MRKTKIFMLSSLSIVGVSLLVGSTFAKWAVTDNADPFVMTVSVGGLPVEAGYYLTFESDNYSPSAPSAIKFSTDSVENKAYKQNISISSGDKARIYYFNGNTYEKDKTPYVFTMGEAHGFLSLTDSTLTFDTSRSGSVFSFYLNNEDKLYVDDETYRDFNGYYVTYQDEAYAFKAANKMISYESGKNLADGSFAFEASKSFKVEHFNGLRGIISSPFKQAANYPNFLSSSYDDSVMTIKDAATYHLMVSRGDSHVYFANESLSSLNGYYILYAPDYSYKTGVKMEDITGDNIAEASLDIAANTTIKIKYVDAVNDTISGDFKQAGTPSYLDTPDQSETLTFNKPDKYDFYLKSTGEIYTAIGSYQTVYLDAGGTSLWEAPLAGKMIYFTNNQSWSNVNIHMWKDGGESTVWPGETMTYLCDNEYGQGIYYYEVPSTYDKVIFNNGSSQTVNISIASSSDGTLFYPDGMEDGKYKVTETTYKSPRVGPIFYAWVWEYGKDGRWVEMTPSATKTGKYEMTIHSYEDMVIFARCAWAPTHSDGQELNDPMYVWNKSINLGIPGDGYCWAVEDWGSGTNVCPGDWSENPI